jgi:DNA topoisomerase-2
MSKNDSKDVPIKLRKHKQIGMREHIKKRSMWAGSKSNQSIDTYTLDEIFDKHTNKTEYVFKPDTLKFPPALFKMIDEIIVNAIDHYVSYPKHVNEIRINISTDGVISVYNDGPGITIEKTKNISGISMYTPQLIFSEFLAGSNLDDDEIKERVVGGQNGLGAKITAVFSKYFTIETTDIINKKNYVQTFSNGLQIIGDPIIKPLSSCDKHMKKSHTKISFLPDYTEFKLKANIFYPTLFKIAQARSWQAAAYTGINIYFNDKKIPLEGFPEFCQMFSEFEIFSSIMNKPDNKYPWEVCIGLTDGKERQISMVNGVFIQSGGTHIKHIQNHLVLNLRDRIEKELRKSKVKFNKNLLLNNLFIFMKGSIPNPEFLSQTKDAISSPLELFKDYQIPDMHWAKIWSLVQPAVMASFLKKQLGDIKLRTNRGRVDVPKYREANYCRNPKKRHECGLIITEGDSATGTAHTGLLSKASHGFNYDYFGVFGIQGVPVNALKESIEFGKKRNTIPKKKSDNYISSKSTKTSSKSTKTSSKSTKTSSINDEESTIRYPNRKLLENERICSLMKVTGLDFNKSYSQNDIGDKEFKTLRYNYIAGLTDQDLDGYNIFGLLSVLILTYWPGLVSRGFLRRIYTPLIRAYPKNRKLLVKEFYTENDAKKWIEEVGEAKVKNLYTFKYYKGLGSHKEAFKEVTNMFKNIENKLYTYILDENAIKNMHIYYGSDTTPRKLVLSTNVSREPVVGLELPMSQQFEIDTKMYQRDNILRKLLSAIDGFVGSRRKVFFTARKIGNREIKVQGLAGETVAKANYHHGEASLEQTIVRMAQAYPGARNLPLLQPLGNFGSRDKGYKDYAASRYIYTTLNYKLADKLFRKEDEFILDYEMDDGIRYEPKYYVPVIPYVICENNELPATGWAICTHARDIISIFKNVRDMINGKIKKCRKLPIWNKDFIGETRVYNNRMYYIGLYEYDDVNNTVHITELPPSKYSYSYCNGSDEVRKKAIDNSKKGMRSKEWIDDIDDNTTIHGIDITIYLKDGAYEAIEKSHGNENFDCFEEYLELKEAIYDRINLINNNNEVVEYTTYENVFDDWFAFRKNLYGIRVEREIVINDLMIKMLINMQRFSISHDDYNITSKTSESKASSIISDHKYDIFNKSMLENPKFTSVIGLKRIIISAAEGATYDYLLTMNYKDLTEESYIKRQKKIDDLKERQTYLLADDKSLFKGASIWLKELGELETSIIDGIASDWFYGENIYNFEDSSTIGVKLNRRNIIKGKSKQ